MNYNENIKINNFCCYNKFNLHLCYLLYDANEVTKLDCHLYKFYSGSFNQDLIRHIALLLLIFSLLLNLYCVGLTSLINSKGHLILSDGFQKNIGSLPRIKPMTCEAHALTTKLSTPFNFGNNEVDLLHFLHP